MRRIRLILSLLALAGLLAGLIPVTLGAQGETPPTERVVVRLYVRDQDHLDAVAGELDIWEAHPEAKYVVAAVTPAQYQWLESLGYELEIDAEKTALLGVRAPLDPRFYYFDDFYPNPNGNYIVDFLQDTNAAYPGLTELIDIGDAWMAGQPGEYDRDIWVLRITNEDPAFGPIEDKPAFFLFATIHAREVTIPELAIRYVKYLTTGYNGEGGYGIDPDVTWLVDWNVAYVLVMQNPDGHWVNEQDTSAYRRKNMDWDDGCNDPDNWGTDLNRNHSFMWNCCGGSSSDPCGETYHGPSAGSEPETQAFQDYFATVMIDQNGPNGDDELPPAAPITTTGIFISMHSHSDLVLWPWGFFDYGPAPNDAQLETIGRKFAYYTNYDPIGSIWYEVDGATDDWTYGKFGVPSFTFEVGPGGGSCGGFFPDYECIDGEEGWPENFWGENRPAFLFAHKIARTPYMTVYGPDAENVVATPGAVEPGTPVDLTATIADHRYGGDPLQPIYAAEYFVDQPGEDGTGTPMAPVDGSWGDLSEDVVVTVDTSGLPLGRHYLLVHGLNDDGDWGPFTAAFLYIVEPGVSPVIEGYVRDAGTNAPLDAVVTANAFQTSTDPATGYYSMTVVSGTYDMSAIAAGYAISTVSGVQAQDYEVVQQDFYLYLFCDVFFDDVESGNIGWTETGLWHISTDPADPCANPYSGASSWYYGQEPQCNYDVGDNSGTLTLDNPIDLSEAQAPATLRFWSWEETEGAGSYDTRGVYLSDNGTIWTQVWQSSNNDAAWYQVELDASSYVGGDLYIRFEFDTVDSLYNDYTGWYVDDIAVAASGPICQPPIAPTAEFTSNSPVELEEPVVFTNLTTGTLPIDYLWDFDDGITSTVEHPTHTYATAGTFTVTLTATNSVGSDSVSHPVVVLPSPCISLTAITIDGPTSGEPGAYTFTTSYVPPDATPPIDYVWDNGDTTSTSIRILDVGTHTLIVTATNCTDTVVMDTHTIVISEAPVCTEVTGVDLTLATTGTIYVGDEVAFNADIAPDDAGKPYSYRVTIDGTPGTTLTASADPLIFTHTFAVTGTHTVEIAVWNCQMTEAEAVTDAVTFMVYEPGVCVDLTGITITGATSGEPGTYTFTTSYEPPDATPPIGYLWDDGGTTATSIRFLGVGTHTLVVTATNCANAMVVDTHTIVIEGPTFYVYLPLVLRNQ